MQWLKQGSCPSIFLKFQFIKGDTFFIPSGTIHAISAGALIAKILENSNVTYRVYDYDRADKNDKKIELHFDKTAKVLDMNSGAIVRQKPRMVHYYPGCSREPNMSVQVF